MVISKNLLFAFQFAYLDPENADKLKSMLFLVWLLDFTSKWVVLGIALAVSVLFVSRKVRDQSFSDGISLRSAGKLDFNEQARR